MEISDIEPDREVLNALDKTLLLIKPKLKVEYLNYLVRKSEEDRNRAKEYGMEHGITYEAALEKTRRGMTDEERRYFMKTPRFTSAPKFYGLHRL